MSKQDKTIRLTIDFPMEQHIYIKMLAAKAGISLRQFVMNHLPFPGNNKKKKNVPTQKKFNHVLDEIIDEYENELRSLADK